MKRSSVCTLLLLAAFATSHAWASQFKVIYTFQGGKDASAVQSQMISDAAGNLYGTSQFGGANGLGTVFKLSNSGGTWTETILYSFAGGTDGEEPVARLAMDAAGNLYGTTEAGGDPTCATLHGYCGTVFELSPGSNGTWTEKILVIFTDTNGLGPVGGLTLDAAGNLYGTTLGGGSGGWGIVFELTPNGDGTWTENIIHNFGLDNNGTKPNSDLVFDSAGNLYGTTADGGLLNDCLAGYGCGTVFELSPQSGGVWTETRLVAFDGKNGSPPWGVSFDPLGNLIGITPDGGAGTCSGFIVSGCGVMFELSAQAGGGFKPKIIRKFVNEPVATPNRIVIDASGNIYGTSNAGGLNTCGVNQPCGTIYKAAPNGSGGYTFSLLYEFPGETANGFWPYAALNIDSAGNIYGSTGNGGNLVCGISGGCGVVFQIIP